MNPEPDPRQEGHTKEWADRARVELNPEEDAKKTASPNQSPESSSEELKENSAVSKEKESKDTFY